MCPLVVFQVANRDLTILVKGLEFNFRPGHLLTTIGKIQLVFLFYSEIPNMDTIGIKKNYDNFIYLIMYFIIHFHTFKDINVRCLK